MSLASGGRALRRHPRRTRSLLRQDVGQNHLEHIAHRTRVAHRPRWPTAGSRPPAAPGTPPAPSPGCRPPARPSPRASAPRSWPRPPAPAVRSAPRPGRRPASPPPPGRPSTGRASAKCTCTSVRIVEPGGAGEALCVRAHPRHRDVRRLPRHRPHRPGPAALVVSICAPWPASTRPRSSPAPFVVRMLDTHAVARSLTDARVRSRPGGQRRGGRSAEDHRTPPAPPRALLQSSGTNARRRSHEIGSCVWG